MTPHLSETGAPAGEGLERLHAQPRAGLGAWPTPVERAQTLGGQPIWVKRDDLSGLGRGGAKARKIDLLVGHLLATGHDELITIAGNVTNIAFDLVPVLDRAGVRATLLIIDDPPLSPPERERIFDGIADRVRLLGPRRSEAARAALAAWRAGRRAGRRPFLLPPGASHPAGVLGNALGFVEMAQQLEAMGEPLPSTVFVTAATGTTVAGFVLGEHLLRLAGRDPVSIIGVEAYGGATCARTRALLRWSERALGTPVRVPSMHVDIDRSALSGGFGHAALAGARLCDRVGEQLGLSIDPIFGGKTWSVLERRAAECTTRGRPPLYWHCGYTPEWKSLVATVQEG